MKGRCSSKFDQHNQKVVKPNDEEEEEANEGDEEDDGSMDEDEDEVDARDDMNPSNLFDEVSLCPPFFYLLSLLLFRKSVEVENVHSGRDGVDTTSTRDVRAYRSRSAHSRSSSASRFQSIGPPATSGDDDMNFYEDKEEDEPAPPQRQVSVSEVC